jgi:hypothetical protein
LILALLLGGLYLYAQREGLALGAAPFTPVLYWNYSGDANETIHVPLGLNLLKLKLRGHLIAGSLRVNLLQGGEELNSTSRFRGDFTQPLSYEVQPGATYILQFHLRRAKGWVLYDWATTLATP